MQIESRSDPLRTVRGVPVLLLLAALCLTSTGCSLFKKTGGSQSAPLFSGDAKAPAKFPTGDPLLPAPGGGPGGPSAFATPSAADNALLAGRVVDGYNRPPGNTTYIRWVCLEENKENAAPIDVTVSPEGYFTIQGLKTGAQYKLIARAKQGEKLIAGVTYTQAPNVRVVIQVKEEFANANTPEVPSSGGAAEAQTEPKKTSDQGVRPPGGTAWGSSTPPLLGNRPGNPAGVGRPAVESDLPAQLNVPGPVSAGPPSWPPGEPNKQWPPTLNITPKTLAPPPPPPPAFRPVPDAPKPPPLPPGDTKLSLTPARGPTCVLVGDQLLTLALNDTNGQTWDLRSQRKGRLVLLDFWATYCMPCRQAMPILTQLQSRYGPQGLEVIGVALEDGGTLREQATRVNALCARMQTNYRQLLGENNRTNIRAQFAIDGIPTMVLIDETGRIVWRHSGVPEQPLLDQVIQQQLTRRAF